MAELSPSTEPLLEPLIRDGDRFGSAVVPLGDLDGDGVQDLAVAAPVSKTQLPWGSLWILFMRADGTVKATNRIYSQELGVPPNDRAFDSVASLGDVDGDGVPDLVAGHIWNDSNVGMVWIVFLNPDGSLKSFVRHDPINPFVFGRFGAAVCGLGDLDQDGVPDLAVGEPGSTFAEPVGLVWLMFLNRDGSLKSFRRLGEGLIGFPGDLQVDGDFGAAIASLGDRDQNGVPDLAIGAPNTGNGEVWIVHLKSKGTKVLSATKITEGEGGFSGSLDTGVRFGSGLAAGDVDGDLDPELLVGMPLQVSNGIESGALWTLELAADGTVAGQTLVQNGAGLPADFYAEGAGFGNILATYDEDGDGTVELLAGSLSPEPRVDVLDFDAQLALTPKARIGPGTPGLAKGVAGGDRLGVRLITLGDLDGDGIPEVASGARDRILVLSLNADGSARSLTSLAAGTPGVPSAIQALASSESPGIAPAGDFDGDGVPDLLTEVTAGSSTSRGLWVLLLNPDGTCREGRQLLGPGQQFGGIFCAVGDLDGDGNVDLVTAGPSNPARIRARLLNADGSVKVSGAPFDFPLVPFDVTAVEALGDLDGDGSPEIAAGAGDSLFILSVASDGSFSTLERAGPADGWGFGKIQPFDEFGSAITGMEDLDQNGVRDLLVGAPGTSPSGRSWLLLLGTDGSIERGFPIDHGQGGLTDELFVFAADHGRVLTSLGDLDRDGTPEIAYGAPRRKTIAGDGSGAIFIATLSRGLWALGSESSVASGGLQFLRLGAGEWHAGRTYQVFGSLAGVAPGFVTSGRGIVMPLNDDGPNGYLLLSALYPNGLFLGDGLKAGFGVLNSEGNANPTFRTLPGLDPAFVGTTFHHAYAVFDPYPTEVVFTSNAIPLTLVD